jgi:tetratricopeptide (TPR) repeat protein
MRSFRLVAGLSLLTATVAARAWSQAEPSQPAGSTGSANTAAAASGVPPIERNPVLDPAIEATIRERLGRTFAQRARNLLQRDAVFMGVLDSAESLLAVSTELVPDNPFVWRLTLDLANAMEDGEQDAAILVDRALERLSALEPSDPVIRLRRLVNAVQKRQTAEERIAAYQQLLEPANIDRIGAQVAARLAFDLALLLQRTGDIEGYRRELLRAIDLDPSYPQATEIAAGYFRTLAPGPAQEASALRAAILANPSQPAAAQALVELCMRTGAYGAASDILNVTAEILARPMPDEQYDGVLADFVLALWGSGRADDALNVIRIRQKQLDAFYLAELERRGVMISTEQRREMHLPPSEPLLTTTAALLVASNPSGAATELSGLAKAFDFRAEIAEAEKAPPERTAGVLLESVNVQFCLGGSVEVADQQLERAEKLAPLSDRARARYDGWRKVRAGDAAAGREILLPNAKDDVLSALGVAAASEALGDKKDAAQRYLAIARENASTALGVWARHRLWTILGKQVPVVPGVAEIESAAQLPEPFLRLMGQGSEALMLRVYPRRMDLSPFDPMVFDIELLNRSDWPLAVSPEGPINDTMTVTATVNVPRRPASAPPFAFLSADREFVIPPGQSLRVPIDLSLTDAAITLREDPLAGALLSIHAISNWRTTTSGLEPGPLGLEVESPETHVAGIRLDAQWVGEQLARLADPSKPVDPDALAMLAHAVVRVERFPELNDDATKKALEPAPAAIAQAAARVSPATRAWLLFCGPRPKRADDVSAQEIVDSASGGVLSSAAAVPSLEPYEAVLRADTDTLVRMAWISTRAKRPEEPILEQTMQLPDARAAAFAKSFQSWMSDAVEERRRRLNLTK